MHDRDLDCIQREQKSLESFLLGRDLEDIEFTPVTEGLGFAGDNPRDLLQRTNEAETESALPPAFIPTSAVKKKNNESFASPSGLDHFYRESLNVELESSLAGLSEDIDSTTEKEISSEHMTQTEIMPQQLMAWLVDISAVTAMVLACAVSFLLISGISLSSFVAMMILPEVVALTAALYTIFYFLYFVFVTRNSCATLGQQLLGIRLVSLSMRSASIKQRFFRSLIVLLSISTLSLPLLLDFHGKLTDTQVLKS